MDKSVGWYHAKIPWPMVNILCPDIFNQKSIDGMHADIQLLLHQYATFLSISDRASADHARLLLFLIKIIISRETLLSNSSLFRSEGLSEKRQPKGREVMIFVILVTPLACL